MSRTFYDRTLGREVPVPSRAELRYRENKAKLIRVAIQDLAKELKPAKSEETTPE